MAHNARTGAHGRLDSGDIVLRPRGRQGDQQLVPWFSAADSVAPSWHTACARGALSRCGTRDPRETWTAWVKSKADTATLPIGMLSCTVYLEGIFTTRDAAGTIATTARPLRRYRQLERGCRLGTLFAFRAGADGCCDGDVRR